MRGRIWQETSELAKLAESLLEKSSAIERRLTTVNAAAVRSDVERQLRHLFFRGFLLFMPKRWLPRLQHYLRGIELRLDKAAHDADRDARRLAELAPSWDRFLETVARRDPAEVESDPWIDYPVRARGVPPVAVRAGGEDGDAGVGEEARAIWRVWRSRRPAARIVVDAGERCSYAA